MSQEEADKSEAIRDAVRKAIDSSMRDSERSEYAKKNMIGVSDIGGCREFVRRTIIDEPYSDEQEDYHAAFVGTAVGDYSEKALVRFAPGSVLSGDLRVQVTVMVELVVRGFKITIPGHADVVVNDGVWDFKTKDGLGVVARTGPEEKHWFQVHLYAKALIDAGEIPPDAWVTLVYIDRSGSQPDPVVFSRRFDPAVLEAAMQWMDDVIYAVQMDEETSRDMPRSWCEACCPRYTACRQPDTDVQGLITNQVVKDAVEVYRDALEREKQAKKDKESAKSALANIAGVVSTDTGPYTLRWVSVDATQVPGYERAGYSKIDLRPVHRAKPRKS
jgi:Arc/MetJ-type ribon-helix-helix transcriptional regulator